MNPVFNHDSVELRDDVDHLDRREEDVEFFSPSRGFVYLVSSWLVRFLNWAER